MGEQLIGERDPSLGQGSGKRNPASRAFIFVARQDVGRARSETQAASHAREHVLVFRFE